MSQVKRRQEEERRGGKGERGEEKRRGEDKERRGDEKTFEEERRMVGKEERGVEDRGEEGMNRRQEMRGGGEQERRRGCGEVRKGLQARTHQKHSKQAEMWFHLSALLFKQQPPLFELKNRKVSFLSLFFSSESTQTRFVPVEFSVKASNLIRPHTDTKTSASWWNISRFKADFLFFPTVLESISVCVCDL